MERGEIGFHHHAGCAGWGGAAAGVREMLLTRWGAIPCELNLNYRNAVILAGAWFVLPQPQPQHCSLSFSVRKPDGRA